MPLADPARDELSDAKASLDQLLVHLLPSGGARLTIRSPDDRTEGIADIVVADAVLHHARDHRGALQRWFAAVAPGGHLVIAVPHAFLFDRVLAAPSALDARAARVYTPGLLTAEIEEALAPNSYRLRHLFDDDAGYDYAASPTLPPRGGRIVAILEKIAPPDWAPGGPPRGDIPSPNHTFFPARTRIETTAHASAGRIVLLKLDHLGDFIMALPAIERVRTAFPTSEITLVVGSWNTEIARGLNLADHIVVFDAFPRNASEEAADVRGRKALFEQVLPGRYDLAIDLRTDPDTRFLLASVDADLRAGLGLESEFPFLDIFLPVDFTRGARETSIEEVLDHHRFLSNEACERNAFRVSYDGRTKPPKGALVYGPYLDLRPGSYLVEPRIELPDGKARGLLKIDLTLDNEIVARQAVTSPDVRAMSFTVGRKGARLEMRLWPDRRLGAPTFNFYGFRLLREGSGDLLHQSEYLLLLVELVALRVGGRLLHENSGAAPA